jgi:hypothetical protein
LQIDCADGETEKSVLRTIDPARDVGSWRTSHATLDGDTDEWTYVVMLNEMPEIVTIRHAHVGRPLLPGREEHPAIGFEQGKRVRLRQILQPLAQKIAHGLSADKHLQLVRGADVKTGDTRLHLLQCEIDHLHVTRCLLGEHDPQVRYRQLVLFDGLAMQIPDCDTASHQYDNDQGGTDCIQVSARAKNVTL